MQEIIRIDLGGVNCYLVENEGNYMLVDAGGHMFMDKVYDNRSDLLMNKLKENGVTKDNLKLLILTHGDCDHVYNAALIKEEFQVPIAMCNEDIYMVKNPIWDCYKVNSKYSSVIFRIVFKIINKKIENLMHRVYDEFKKFEPDIVLKEGMNLKEYGFDGEVYITPGHTSGSICIFTSDGSLICGDLFGNSGKPVLAINAADFDLLKEQAMRMLMLPVKNILPGHGQAFEPNNIKIK